MDPFLAQLAACCTVERTRPKWVVVPGHALGHTLGERLAREGTSWANLRFTPPLDLALQMAAPYLVERGIDPAPDGVGPALITRLLLDLPGTTPAYFRPLGEQPRMADALWAALRRVGPVTGVRIRLAKGIPIQAGLGGGSADAAAALLALAHFWGVSVRPNQLTDVAASLGADVPFFLSGGTALGLGRGDEIYPLADLPPLATVPLSRPA